MASINNDMNQFKVYDNVLSQTQIEAWQNYYQNVMQFRRAGSEQTDTVPYLSSDISLQDMIEIFDYEHTLMPNIKDFNHNVKNRFNRSYINMIVPNQSFVGHKDIQDIEDGKHFVTSILFLNPFLESSNAGIELLVDGETVVIEHKFNRQLVFNGDVFHTIQTYNDSNHARLTLYTSHSDAVPVMTIAKNNRW